MTDALRRPGTGSRPDERRLSLASALLSAGLHLLVLLLAASWPPVTNVAPQGAAGGSRVEVTFIDETADSAPFANALSVQPTPSRVRATPVARAEEPIQREAAQSPAASPPPTPTTRPRAHAWGQPPGMLPQDHAPVNAGRALSPAVDQSRGQGASSGESSLEVGGYQVLYDLRSESRLRTWRDEGMTEVFIPLPGAREYMVCPLETALRRESGACRLLDPDDPEMAAIGDAREVINTQRVYRRGELLWSGPRPYR